MRYAVIIWINLYAICVVWASLPLHSTPSDFWYICIHYSLVNCVVYYDQFMTTLNILNRLYTPYDQIPNVCICIQCTTATVCTHHFKISAFAKLITNFAYKIFVQQYIRYFLFQENYYIDGDKFYKIFSLVFSREFHSIILLICRHIKKYELKCECMLIISLHSLQILRIYSEI